MHNHFNKKTKKKQTSPNTCLDGSFCMSRVLFQYYLRLVKGPKNIYTGLFSKNSQQVKVVNYHCIKSVCIRSFSDPYFTAFGLNTELIQSECGKIRTRKTPNTDTFHAVYSRSIPSKVFERVLNTSLILFNPFLVNVFRGCKMKTLP